MTTYYKTQAFVFKKTDRNESDRVFSVFTNDFGRLDIFAKAIRKSTSKLKGGIGLFSVSEIKFIQGKNRKTLTDAVFLEKFNKLPGNLEKFKIANAISEVLENLIKGEQAEKDIFNLIKETFEKINNHNNHQLVYYYFLWNFISILGYCPEVNKCHICNIKLNPYHIYFSIKLGGIVCKKCLCNDKTAIKINSDIVKILRLFLKKDWQTSQKLKIGLNTQKLFKKVSDEYYLYILSNNSFKNVIINYNE